MAYCQSCADLEAKLAAAEAQRDEWKASAVRVGTEAAEAYAALTLARTQCATAERERDEAKALNREWFQAAIQQHLAYQRTSPFRTDAWWDVEALARMVTAKETAESSLASLRQQITGLVTEMEREADQYDANALASGDMTGLAMATIARKSAHQVADLLSRLGEGIEQQEQEKDQARHVDTGR